MIRAALEAATRRLARSSSSPRLDAELLLADLLALGRAQLLAHDTDPLASRWPTSWGVAISGP